ncbi:MAG: flavin oxidoreductase/NADH oxidase [Candidatus Fimivivens sp.]
MEHIKFHYRSLQDLRKELARLQVTLPLEENTAVLGKPISFGQVTLPNRLAIAPMEGADSLPDGSPSEMTRRRYLRFAEGGASLLWFEAVAVVPEGRSSPKQLMLNRNTLPAFQKMLEEVRQAGYKKNGYVPYLVMQANHSGRYAKPNGTSEPIIAYHHPVYEAAKPVDSSRIATDEYLKRLEEQFGEAALLCREAGFDAVDIKSCHGYLFAEFASAFTRKGPYGGSFENRTRLLRNAVNNAQAARTKKFLVTARIGIYDGFAYPYGFGSSTDGSQKPDYTEPVKLIQMLHQEMGMSFLNLTMGNPYQNTHVTRPYDMGKYVPPEHPLEGVARMYEGCHHIKKQFPNLVVSASAPSYLRAFSPALAAGAVVRGCCDFVCFGRLAFAYPNFPNTILQTGGIDEKKCCITCGKCGDLIRAGLPTGCVVWDAQTYLEYYRQMNY